MRYEEMKEKKSVFLNIDNSLYFAKSNDRDTKIFNLVKEPEQPYSQVAKKGVFKERPAYLFKKTINDVDIEIKVIRENETFIVAINQALPVEMRDSNFNLLKQTTLNLYDNLKSGLYFVNFKNINKEIRIKLI